MPPKCMLCGQYHWPHCDLRADRHYVVYIEDWDDDWNDDWDDDWDGDTEPPPPRKYVRNEADRRLLE